jgi:O-antigen/teichoic acid export membrane protein
LIKAGPEFEEAEARRIRGATSAFTDYLSLTGAGIVSAVLSIASVLITTRILAPADYALLAYLAVAGTLIVTVSAYWTAAAVLRYGREELESCGTMASVTWSRLVIVAPLFVLAAGVLVGLALANALPRGFSWTMTALAVAYGFLLFVAEHISSTLQAVDEIKRSALGSIVRHASVFSVLIVILVSGRGASPVAIAAANVAASALVTWWLASTVWKVALWPPSVDQHLRGRIVRFSVPLIAFTVGQYVIASVDLIVIGAFSGAHDAGIYAVAYQGYTVLQQVAGACVPVLVPLLVSIRLARNEALVVRYFERVMPQLLFLGSLIGGLIVPIVPLSVSLLLGNAFGEASQPLVVLFAALLLFFGASLVAPVMMLNELTLAVGGIATLAALTNVVGDVVLIGVLGYGVWAAAVATTGSVAVIWSGYLLVSRRALQSNVFPHPMLFAPFVAGLIPALALSPALALLVGLGASLATGAVVLRLLRPFGAADITTIDGLQVWAPIKRIAVRFIALAGR